MKAEYLKMPESALYDLPSFSEFVLNSTIRDLPLKYDKLLIDNNLNPDDYCQNVVIENNKIIIEAIQIRK